MRANPFLLAIALCLALSACQPSETRTTSRLPPSTPSDTDLLARGEYLVRTTGCNDCHTPGYAESGGTTDKAGWLVGSPMGFHGPWGTTYPSNLRLRMQQLTEAQWLEYSANLRTRPMMPDFAVRAMTEETVARSTASSIRWALPASPRPRPCRRARRRRRRTWAWCCRPRRQMRLRPTEALGPPHQRRPSNIQKKPSARPNTVQNNWPSPRNSFTARYTPPMASSTRQTNLWSRPWADGVEAEEAWVVFMVAILGKRPSGVDDGHLPRAPAAASVQAVSLRG